MSAAVVTHTDLHRGVDFSTRTPHLKAASRDPGRAPSSQARCGAFSHKQGQDTRKDKNKGLSADDVSSAPYETHERGEPVRKFTAFAPGRIQYLRGSNGGCMLRCSDS